VAPSTSSPPSAAEAAAAPAPSDPYEAVLSSTYRTYFLPALTHAFVNYDTLQENVLNGPKGRFGGVVVTSQRAVEAWAHCRKSAEPRHVDVSSNDAPSSSEAQSAWDEVPFYCVGPATAASLLALNTQTCVVPPSSMVRGGEESGNADKLADYIIAMHGLSIGSTTSSCDSSPSQGPLEPAVPQPLPLLYLVGDKTRETIAGRLSSAGIPVVKLHVYDTFPSPTFDENFRAVVNEAGGIDHLRWIAFFSPSGAKQALPLLASWKEKLDLGPRIAAIGPTTRDYLLGAGIEVHAMAHSPKPEALLQAIRLYDGR